MSMTVSTLRHHLQSLPDADRLKALAGHAYRLDERISKRGRLEQAIRQNAVCGQVFVQPCYFGGYEGSYQTSSFAIPATLRAYYAAQDQMLAWADCPCNLAIVPAADLSEADEEHCLQGFFDQHLTINT